jgi:hypothetical protein
MLSEGTPACWVEGFVCLSEAAGYTYACDITGDLLPDKLTWIKPSQHISKNWSSTTGLSCPTARTLARKQPHRQWTYLPHCKNIGEKAATPPVDLLTPLQEHWRESSHTSSGLTYPTARTLARKQPHDQWTYLPHCKNIGEKAATPPVDLLTPLQEHRHKGGHTITEICCLATHGKKTANLIIGHDL